MGAVIKHFFNLYVPSWAMLSSALSLDCRQPFITLGTSAFDCFTFYLLFLLKLLGEGFKKDSSSENMLLMAT
jgi:hypothetical protein